MSAYPLMDADTMAALTCQEWTQEALEQLAECCGAVADPEPTLAHPFEVYRMEAAALSRALMGRVRRARFYLRYQHGGIVWFSYTCGGAVFGRFGRIVRAA